MFNKFIFIALVFCVRLFGQEGLPIYTDYLTDNYYLVHPAMAGAELFGGKTRLTARKQWFDQEDSPSLQTFSTSYRLSDRSGVGGILFNDKNGYYSTSAINLTYAHHVLFDDKEGSCSCNYPNHENPINQLSFGLSVGVLQHSLDQSTFDLFTFDPLITGLKKSLFYFNIDIGFSYLNSNFYAHLSLKNLLFSPHNLYGDFDYNYRRSSSSYRRLLASAGKFFYLEKNWIFEPSFLFQITEITREKSIDINLKVYRELKRGRLWTGISFRNGFENAQYTIDGVVQRQNLKTLTPLMGYQVNNFVFAYNFSQPQGAISFGSGGFHQITLGFNFAQR